jgi:hypothetical protein
MVELAGVEPLPGGGPYSRLMTTRRGGRFGLSLLAERVGCPSLPRRDDRDRSFAEAGDDLGVAQESHPARWLGGDHPAGVSRNDVRDRPLSSPGSSSARTNPAGPKTSRPITAVAAQPCIR